MNLVVFLSYTILTLVLGLYFVKKSQTLREFSIGSKNYSTPILFATLSATFIGGNSILGGIEYAFKDGIINIYLAIGTAISSFIMAYWLVPKMGAFMGKISVGDIFETSYGRLGRLTGGLFSFLFCIVVFASQISFFAYTLETFLNISPFWSLLTGASTLILYSAFGGIRSVTITDILQFLFLIIIVPIALHLTLGHSQGIGPLINSIPSSHLKLLPDNKAIPFYLCLFLTFCIPYLYPPILQRILMSRSLSQAKSIFSALGLFQIAFYIMVGSIGIIIFAINPNLAPKEAFSYLINNVLASPLFKNIIVLGLVAAIVSTADSFLNSGSIAFVQDIAKPLRSKNSKQTDKDDLKLARMTTFLMGFFAIAIAMGPFNSIVDITLMAFSFWTPTIVIPLIGTILGFKATPRGFLTSILAGGVATLLWKLNHHQFIELNERFIGVLVNLSIFSISCYRNRAAWKKYQPEKPKSAFTKLISYWNLPNLRKYIPSFKNIVKFAEDRANRHSPQYFTFGLFIIINFSIPIFLWSYDLEYPDIALTMRILGGLLCCGLLIKSALPQKVQRYYPLYWQFSILYCLPFLGTYMLLNSEMSQWWLINISLVLIMGTILLDTLSFVVINLIGSLLAYLFSALIHGFQEINLHYEAIYLWLFCIGIGLLFSRIRDMIHLKGELSKMQAMGATIAHEMRTPLSTASGIASSMETILPHLSYAYEIARDNDLLTEDHLIEPIRYRRTNKIPLILERSSRSALTNIDILLKNIKGVNFEEDQQKLSLQNCIETALDEYPFQGEEERQLVKWNNKAYDFTILGNEDLLKYVIFNLLKNALYYLKVANSGEIKIWTEDKGSYGVLYFEDSSTGIEAQKLGDIFKRFYSQRKGGTGLGLWFCKEVMDSMKGTIHCNSEISKYTQFVLTFPKSPN